MIARIALDLAEPQIEMGLVSQRKLNSSPQVPHKCVSELGQH